MYHFMPQVDAAPSSSAPPRQLGYDAIEERGRRRVIRTETRREEEILNGAQRSKLTSGTRDLRRNFEVAAWMVRKHLDFVSRFRYESRTVDKGFNRDMEALVREWSKRENFDAARRHSRERAVRMLEAARTLDGDALVVKLRTGQVQLVEADRVRDPIAAYGSEAAKWAGGVHLDAADAAIGYGVHKRLRGGGFEWEREVPARNAWLHGYFDRFDQCRGVSPMASALARLTHVYEGMEFAHAKAKIQQLLGLIFTRQFSPTNTDFGTTEAEETDEDGNTTRYKVDMGRGSWQLDMEPGDDVKVVETEHPSDQFQAYTTLALGIGLKSLDIPFSFFDESHTNFHGSLRALQLYVRSCKAKQEDNQELQREWLRWRAQLAILRGELQLPSGWTIDDLQDEWVPDGVPWFDKAKETSGDILAIGAGLDNPQRIALERGLDFEENIDRIAEACSYAREKLEEFGMRLSFDAPAMIEVPEDKPAK